MSNQGCDLGLDISASRWCQDVLMSRLGQNDERLSLKSEGLSLGPIGLEVEASGSKVCMMSILTNFGNTAYFSRLDLTDPTVHVSSIVIRVVEGTCQDIM